MRPVALASPPAGWAESTLARSGSVLLLRPHAILELKWKRGAFTMAAMADVKRKVQTLINSAANADERGDFFVRLRSLFHALALHVSRLRSHTTTGTRPVVNVYATPIPPGTGRVYDVLGGGAVHLSSAAGGQQ